MKVPFSIGGRKRAVSLPANAKLESLLEKIGHTPETALITVDGKLTLASKKIPKGKIIVYGVISRG